MRAGSVSDAAISALAWAMPLAELAGVADEELFGEFDVALVAEVGDEELHADATATHAVVRTMEHAVRSFMAMSPLRGRKARSRASDRRPDSIG
jgi:hypothetical protein